MIIKSNPDHIEIYYYSEDEASLTANRRQHVHQVLVKSPTENFHISKVEIGLQIKKTIYKFNIDRYSFIFENSDIAEKYFDYIVNNEKKPIQEIYPELFL